MTDSSRSQEKRINIEISEELDNFFAITKVLVSKATQTEWSSTKDAIDVDKDTPGSGDKGPESAVSSEDGARVELPKIQGVEDISALETHSQEKTVAAETPPHCAEGESVNQPRAGDTSEKKPKKGSFWRKLARKFSKSRDLDSRAGAACTDDSNDKKHGKSADRAGSSMEDLKQGGNNAEDWQIPYESLGSPSMIEISLEGVQVKIESKRNRKAQRSKDRSLSPSLQDSLKQGTTGKKCSKGKKDKKTSGGPKPSSAEDGGSKSKKSFTTKKDTKKSAVSPRLSSQREGRSRVKKKSKEKKAERKTDSSESSSRRERDTRGKRRANEKNEDEETSDTSGSSRRDGESKAKKSNRTRRTGGKSSTSDGSSSRRSEVPGSRRKYRKKKKKRRRQKTPICLRPLPMPRLPSGELTERGALQRPPPLPAIGAQPDPGASQQPGQEGDGPGRYRPARNHRRTGRVVKNKPSLFVRRLQLTDSNNSNECAALRPDVPPLDLSFLHQGDDTYSPISSAQSSPDWDSLQDWKRKLCLQRAVEATARSRLAVLQSQAYGWEKQPPLLRALPIPNYPLSLYSSQEESESPGSESKHRDCSPEPEESPSVPDKQQQDGAIPAQHQTASKPSPQQTTRKPALTWDNYRPQVVPWRGPVPLIMHPRDLHPWKYPPKPLPVQGAYGYYRNFWEGAEIRDIRAEQRRSEEEKPARPRSKKMVPARCDTSVCAIL